MKRITVAILASLGLAANAASASNGSFTLFGPGPADSFDTIMQIRHNDTFDLTRIVFDLSGTTAKVGGPLVFGGFGGSTGPNGGTASIFGVEGTTSFGFDFTGFNSGDVFEFSWDADVAEDNAYGAVVAETAGMMATLFTTGGTVFGTLTLVTNTAGEQDLLAIIASPGNNGGGTAPEPGTLALLGLGMAGLGFLRRKAH